MVFTSCMGRNTNCGHSGFILLDKTKNGERREILINDTLKRVFHSLRHRIDVAHVFYDHKRLKPYQDI